MAFAPTATLGLRVAHSFGLVGVWLGVDVASRLTKLQVGARQPARVGDVAGLVTAGVSFLDWSRK